MSELRASVWYRRWEEGVVRGAGRVVLPAVGLALFLISGCRFGEPSSAPPPPGESPPAAGSADAGPGDVGGAAPISDAPWAAALRLVAERRQAGLNGEAIDALLEIAMEASEEILVSGEGEAAILADQLSTPALRDLIEDAPRHPRFLPLFLAELATRRYLVGDRVESQALAQEILAMSRSERASERARSILEGRMEAGLALDGTIAAILSISGSPSLRQISEEMREGIELAVAVDMRDSPNPVRLLVFDDAGSAARAGAVMDSVAAEGVSGMIGPIFDPVMAAAAGLRSPLIPLLSPTARLLPGGEGLFSLSGVDPEAGRALARLVLGRGVREVVLVHAVTPEMQEEARWFREAFESEGGTIRRALTYTLSAASFAPLMQEIIGLAPRGLVLLLPLSGGDVERVASQLTFYGVDRVPGLVRFGNESWTSPAVLQGTDARHTNGVLAVSRSAELGELGPGWGDFRREYEAHFRRTLRSSAPAFGYDAARLLLQAARAGGGTPQGTLRALEGVRDYPGATGTLSVVEGRVEREYYPVRVENRTFVRLTP